jgi:hypothetical protein
MVVPETYISVEDCVHGGLYYLLECPHFRYGVYNAQTQCFVGIRQKFAVEYIEEVPHTDVEPNYVAAKPIELLDACPLSNLGRGEVINRIFRRNKYLYRYLRLSEQIFENNRNSSVA